MTLNCWRTGDHPRLRRPRRRHGGPAAHAARALAGPARAPRRRRWRRRREAVAAPGRWHPAAAARRVRGAGRGAGARLARGAGASGRSGRCGQGRGRRRQDRRFRRARQGRVRDGGQVHRRARRPLLAGWRRCRPPCRRAWWRRRGRGGRPAEARRWSTRRCIRGPSTAPQRRWREPIRSTAAPGHGRRAQRRGRRRAGRGGRRGRARRRDARSAEARLAQGPPEPGAAAAPRRPAGQGGPARAASQSLPGPGEPAAARAASGERAGSDGELGELSWTARRRAQTLPGPCPAPGHARHAACLGYAGVARSGRRRCGAPEPRAATSASLHAAQTPWQPRLERGYITGIASWAPPRGAGGAPRAARARRAASRARAAAAAAAARRSGARRAARRSAPTARPRTRLGASTRPRRTMSARCAGRRCAAAAPR